MKPRPALLLANFLLCVSLVLAMLAWITGKPAKSAAAFELPAPVDAPQAETLPVAPAHLAEGNLFHPLRGTAKPVGNERKTTSRAPQPPEPGKPGLTGIVQFGSMRGVILTDALPLPEKTGKGKTEKKPMYREGDQITGGFRIQTIHPDHVVLIRNGKTQILPLHPKQEKKP